MKTASQPILDVENLQVRYMGSIVGAENVSFMIEKGRTVAILGANGAGKTTTLRAISGFIGIDHAAISRGRILFEGENITGLPPHAIAQRGLVIVPEREKIFPNLSVSDNITLVSGSGSKSLETAFDFFPRLVHLKDKEAGLLSGGERQMLAIAAALACRPRLLVIDELSLGLSPVVVKDLVAQLLRIRDQLSLTVLLVEQSAHTAFTIADEAYVMENGRIVQHGSTHDLQQDERVQEYYLGGRSGERRSYRDMSLDSVGGL